MGSSVEYLSEEVVLAVARLANRFRDPSRQAWPPYNFVNLNDKDNHPIETA